MTSSESTEAIHCPNCGSQDWRCYNDGSIECWDMGTEEDGYCSTYSLPYGDLACNACNHAWRDYPNGYCEEHGDSEVDDDDDE